MPDEDEPQPTGVTDKFRASLGTRSPFLWLVLMPVVTLPLSALLVFVAVDMVDARALGLPGGAVARLPSGQSQWTGYLYFDFWRTWMVLTAPGLLNLLVALWWLHRLRYVRVAATAAFAIAIVGTFVLPPLLFVIGEDKVISEASLLIRVRFETTDVAEDASWDSLDSARIRLLTTVWMGWAFTWMASLAAWKGFDLLMDRYWPELEPPRKRQAGEPRSWGSFLERR